MSTKNEEVLTLEKAKELGLYTHSYPNGDQEYKDTDGYYHLIRDGEELLPEVKKVKIYSQLNGVCYYHILYYEGKEFNRDEFIKELEKAITLEYPKK